MRTVILLSLLLSLRGFLSCKVLLCEHDQTIGKCCEKGLGSYDTRALGGSCPNNDDLSMVKIAGRCSIILYKEGGFRGPSTIRVGPGLWKSRHIPNNSVSSFRIVNIKCLVTLCEHKNKRGKCCHKGVGLYSIGSLRGKCPGNDAVSFVQIKGRCRARLFQHGAFRGRSASLYGPGSWNAGRGGKFPDNWVSSFAIKNY